jgi:hypothetical protein
MSISADGSVKGKWCGRKRTTVLSPVKPFRKNLEGALEVRHRDPAVDHKPLDLMEQGGVGRVDRVAPVYTRPGAMMRMGGFCFFMVLICTGDVCVRSTNVFGNIERILGVARGWFFGMFSASKL